jgi:hypothetical protein
MECKLAANSIILQAVSEREATCLAAELSQYAVQIGRQNSFWEVSVPTPESQDGDGVLDRVIEAAMECFADRRVTGFALIADGHRYPLGMD